MQACAAVMPAALACCSHLLAPVLSPPYPPPQKKTGRLSICYLGTDPPSIVVAPSSEAKPLDYAAMDEEHRRLMGQIKAAGGAVSR